MKATDVFCWVVIGGAIFMVFLLFFWSLCSIAKLSDKRSERYWKKNFKDKERQNTIEPPKAAGDHRTADGSSQREGDNHETQNSNRTQIKHHRRTRCNRKTTSKRKCKEMV